MLIRKAGGSQGVARCGFILFGQPTSIGAHNRAKLTAKVRQRGSAFAAAAHQVGRQCCAGPPPVRKINSKGPPFSMRGVRAIAANRARARRVVPISELLFGTLTPNQSSLEPSLGFAAIAGTPRIVVHDTYKSCSRSLSDDTYRFFADIRRIAEQLTAVKRWYRIVGYALIKYLRGQQLRPPPPLQHAQPCPVRLKTAFGARVATHGFSFIGTRLSHTVVLWPSNRYRCSGTCTYGGRTI